jgi:tripartite-type tricarboxylate transporter receptor subunit TctC
MKAAPDGYTIGIVDTASLAIVQASGQLGGLDLRKNLVWLGRTEAPGFLVIAQKASRFKSIRDIAGQQVRLGCTTQEAAQLVVLIKALGGKPYVTMFSGFAEIIPALRRDEFDLCMSTYSSGLKSLASSEGELVPSLICRTDSRPELPNVPNLRNVGLESMIDVLGGDRLVGAPAGLSLDVQKILGDAIAKATTDREFVSRMEKAGYLPAGGAEPAELKRLTEHMLDKITGSKDVWGPFLIK